MSRPIHRRPRRQVLPPGPLWWVFLSLLVLPQTAVAVYFRVAVHFRQESE